MKKSIFKNILSFTLFMCIGYTLLAQPLREVTYGMMLETADKAYEVGDYYNAADWYAKAYKEQRDKDLAIKIAECYTNIRDYKRALGMYKRVLDRDKNGIYKKYKLEYGKTLKLMGEYSDSYKVLNEFINESTDLERKKEAALLVNGIAKSSEFEENVDAIIAPVHRNVNSASSESGPRSYGDELYYSSLNRKDAIVYNDDLEGETHFKIYTTSVNKKGDYDKGSALSDEINREGFHTGNPSFSPDGMKMYFTRTLVEEGQILESKIYYSNRKGNNWSAAYELEGDINNNILKYPAIGELYGKKVIFFASEIEGGFGGLDIYYSESTGADAFGTPINLGESINSKYDEVTPFYRDGALFYSTEGKPGYGGKDIFKTTWDGSSWSEITNMGSGFNSSLDDTYYTMDEKGLQGFFVSNRVFDKKRSVQSKTCCDDIFSVTFKEVVIDLLAKITDGTDPLPEAELTLVDLTVGDTKKSPEKKVNLTSNDFNFALDQDKKYKVVIKRDGYYPDSIQFNTVGILDDYTVDRTIALKIIPPPPPPKEEVEIITTNTPIRMNSIYYDLGSAKILPTAQGDLNFILDIMNKYPSMVIELGSHTDAQGLTKNNQQLSQRRSESAKKWLTDKGVSIDRIQAVGYGESLILNQCTNGVKCSDEEHRFNRRTEFKIISGPTTIEVKKRKVIPRSGGLPMNLDIDLYSLQVDTNDENTILEFEKNSYQIGTLKLGEVIDMEFVYENKGTTDLIIEIVTACHCTTFKYEDKPLKPGEKATIYVNYDTGAKNKTGVFREAVNIICNTENLVEEAIFHVTVEE